MLFTDGDLYTLGGAEGIVFSHWLELYRGETLTGEAQLAALTGETLVLWRAGLVDNATLTAIRDIRRGGGTVFIAR